MIDAHVLDLVAKGLVTDQVVLHIGYDIENLTDPEISKNYTGEITIDHYGRKTPKHAHGTVNFGYTSSVAIITKAALGLFESIVDDNLLIRRINITTNHVVHESSLKTAEQIEQLDLFTDYDALQKTQDTETATLEREKRMQQAIIAIKGKYGKNAIFKGMNLQEGATARERNRQIGGHKA